MFYGERELEFLYCRIHGYLKIFPDTEGLIYDYQSIPDKEGLIPKKMEELAQQAAHDIYSKENTDAYESLRSSYSFTNLFQLMFK